MRGFLLFPVLAMILAGAALRADEPASPVADLAALERVTDQIGLQLESTALDLSAPPRVTLLEEATVGVKR